MKPYNLHSMSYMYILWTHYTYTMYVHVGGTMCIYTIDIYSIPNWLASISTTSVWFSTHAWWSGREWTMWDETLSCWHTRFAVIWGETRKSKIIIFYRTQFKMHEHLYIDTGTVARISFRGFVQTPTHNTPTLPCHPLQPLGSVIVK